MISEQEPLVKLQIVTLAAKLSLLSTTDRTLGLLNQYIFSLARYDLNYDVRDRARMLSSLLAGLNPDISGTNHEARAGVVLRKEQVRLVLFEGKSGMLEFEPSNTGTFSSSCILLKLITSPKLTRT